MTTIKESPNFSPKPSPANKHKSNIANYQISEWILYVVPLLIGNCFPFNVIGEFAQFWTTSKPNDRNIELAISALCALEKRNLISDLANSFVDELFKRL